MGRPRIHRRDLPERVYFKDGAYYYVHPIINKWENLGHDHAKAMARWSTLLLEGTSRATGVDTTVGTLLDRYLLEVVPSKAPRTQKDNQQEVRFLRAFFGSMELSQVSTAAVAQYVATRRAKIRCNREVALLSHAFNKAILWGLVEKNPCSVPGVRNPETARDRYVTDEEIEKFKEAAPPWLRRYVELKLLLGLRQQDMLKLKWSDLQEDCLQVNTLKTGKKLKFALTPELRVLLSHFPKDSVILFPTKSGKMYGSAGFKSAWRRAMDSYALTGNQRFNEHDLRGKVGTDMNDPYAAQKLLGHASITMTEAYMKQRQIDIVQPARRKK